MSVIVTKKLTKVFSGKVRAVDGIDLEIESGEIFGFLGPNGAGKTTTLLARRWVSPFPGNCLRPWRVPWRRLPGRALWMAGR
jgi:ABC-2 type transport system ATP-binding protein